jgi:XRE family transcriptional regulator, regulator of sulfur utilization
VRPAPAKPRKERRKAQTAKDVRRTVGARIAELRRARGWSQERLAEVSGMHRNFLSEIERGVKGTTIVALARVAKGLGVDPSTLVDLRADATTEELRDQAQRKLAALDRDELLSLLRLLDAVQPSR